MKIGIDARFVGPQGTGLGKYTEKLIENLAQEDQENQYVVFLKKDNWDYLDLDKNKNFKKVLANVSWYGAQEQIKLPGIFQNQNLDLLHVPHFNAPLLYRGKFVVTIHDLIHHQFKESSTTTRNQIIFKIKRLSYKLVITNAVKRSSKIISPSNFVKSEIVKNFNVKPDKIAVTYEAAEDEYYSKEGKRQSNILEKYSIQKPFLIYVGNAYPHKNLDNLLEAMKLLAAEGPKLVIACARDVFYSRLQKKIEELDLAENVTLTGYIPAKDLVPIFQQAQAYVFPTFSEGFGIPGLNAMASGLPVAASSIATLKEVYGDAAIYFDPSDPKDIAVKLKTLLQNSKTRSDLIKKGSVQAKKYSWQKMARQTLEIYKQA